MCLIHYHKNTLRSLNTCDSFWLSQWWHVAFLRIRPPPFFRLYYAERLSLSSSVKMRSCCLESWTFAVVTVIFFSIDCPYFLHPLTPVLIDFLCVLSDYIQDWELRWCASIYCWWVFCEIVEWSVVKWKSTKSPWKSDLSPISSPFVFVTHYPAWNIVSIRSQSIRFLSNCVIS